jgi:hypothetical protein
MKDLLRSLLTPADDGRAFADAVLLRASGALHRRHQATEAATEPVWGLLERWAHPWLVAALLLLAVAAAVPAWAPPAPAAAPTFDSALATVLPADVAAATAVMKE